MAAPADQCDFDLYESSVTFDGTSVREGATLDERWLAPLLRPVPDEEARGRCIALAEAQGPQLFHVVDGSSAQAAARQFHKDGFVALRDVLTGEELTTLQAASAQIVRRAVRANPYGNRGANRYSMHRTTMVGACLEVVDNLAVCSVLEHIWRCANFTVQCTGGDFSLPGAAVQEMHADMGSRHNIERFFAYHDPEHPGRGFCDLPTPVVKVYFAMVDFDDATGPPLFVPGSHWRYAREDVPEDDPPESVQAFCPRGSAILMDMRVWHHGTENRSQIARPMLSVHYAGPWYNEAMLLKTSMCWEYHKGAVSLTRLRSLRVQAQRLCKNLLPDRCYQCDCLAEQGRRGTGLYAGFWYCLECWEQWQAPQSEAEKLIETGAEVKTQHSKADF